MNISALVGYLQSKGVGTPGQDLFAYQMPEIVDQGVMLLDDLSGSQKDHELPGLHRGKIQVIVRHTDYASGIALVQQVSDALAVQNITIDTMDIRYLRPRSEPIVYPFSKGNHLEFSVTFDTVYINL